MNDPRRTKKAEGSLAGHATDEREVAIADDLPEERVIALFRTLSATIAEHARRLAMEWPIDPDWLIDELQREFFVDRVGGRLTVIRHMRRVSADGTMREVKLDILGAYTDEKRLSAYVKRVAGMRARELYRRAVNRRPTCDTGRSRLPTSSITRIQTMQERRRRLMHRMALELAAAYERSDDEGVKYCRAALDEMEGSGVNEQIEDLNAWKEGLAASSEGRKVLEAHERERAAFLQRYLDCKAKAGLCTLRQVAERAGLSVTTVQGIEAGRLKPQFRTLEKLAQAFGVSVSELAEPDPR